MINTADMTADVERDNPILLVDPTRMKRAALINLVGLLQEHSGDLWTLAQRQSAGVRKSAFVADKMRGKLADWHYVEVFDKIGALEEYKNSQYRQAA